MSYGDTYIRRVEESVDDEYQERVLFQAESVGLRYMYWGILLTVAILAWVLPGEYIFWSLTPVLALIIGSFAEMGWMKKYAPRPRPLRFSVVEVVMLVVFAATWIAGALVNGKDYIYSDSLTSGFFTGLILGPFGAIIAMKIMRASDEKRLNAALDAEADD